MLERPNIFRETPSRREDAFGFLHSTDGCRTWTFYETPPVAYFSGPFPRKLYLGEQRLERLEAHNQIVGPPPMVEGRGRELVLYIATKKPDGRLNPVERLLINDVKPPVAGKGRNWITHSGAGNVSATFDGKTHVVWQSIQPFEWHREEVESLSNQMQGPYTPYALRYKDGLGALAPQYIRTYDHETGQLGPSVLLGFARRDNHDPGVISVDSQGYLHVVIGAHHDNFQYTRSLRPNSSTDGWTDPVMFGTPRPPPGQTDTGSYSYTAMLIDQDDTIHLVSRWAGDGAYHFALCYNRKKASQDWEPNSILMHPFRYGYCTWRPKLNIDRLGRLWLSYVLRAEGPGLSRSRPDSRNDRRVQGQVARARRHDPGRGSLYADF